MPSFKAVLNECATREVYLKTCRRIADNEKYTPEFQSDRWVELGRKEKPGLTNAVLEDMFSPETTQYGRYWKTPKLGCEGITLKEPGPGENPEVWQRELVSRVFEQLQSMEATSVVLKCVHPRYFGIYSPVTLTLLQVPLESPRAEIMYLAPVYHYLKCCNEIGDWGAKFLPKDTSVAETDSALWVFYEAAYGHEPIEEKKMKSYRAAFESDEWVNRRRAQNVLRHHFAKYKPRRQADFLLEIDANLSAKILGCEFEAGIKKLVDPDETKREKKLSQFRDANPNLANSGDLNVMVRYVVAKKLCSVSRADLVKTRDLRNDAVHMLRGFNDDEGRSDVKYMIEITDRVRKDLNRIR